ncbi:MAG: hypothetical protein MUQ10_16145 [Anaerolineae bacterium]|nr:hypothetical protein [Anaerolineae bacterium]
MEASILYSTSQELRVAIRDTAERIIGAFGQPIELVEYITLPDFGQRVILRFELRGTRFASLGEADTLESRLRGLAGSDYWTTLVDNYQGQADYDLAQRLTQIDQALPAGILRFHPTQHSERIRRDAQLVRDALDLTEDYLIWEIEVPISSKAAPTILRIIDTGEEGEGFSSRRTSERVKVGEPVCEVVFLKNNPSFAGCVKAYFAAQERQMALNSFIAQFGNVST